MLRRLFRTTAWLGFLAAIGYALSKRFGTASPPVAVASALPSAERLPRAVSVDDIPWRTLTEDDPVVSPGSSEQAGEPAAAAGEPTAAQDEAEVAPTAGAEEADVPGSEALAEPDEDAAAGDAGATSDADETTDVAAIETGDLDDEADAQADVEAPAVDADAEADDEDLEASDEQDAAEAVAPAPWVEPDAGSCPLTHPVKAKLASRIYHVPGGLSYARTAPERCYATPEDAEADGFRKAKR